MIATSGLLALSLWAAGADVLARVDGVEITAEALARRVQQVRAEGKRASTEDVFESLVDEVVLAADARQNGLAARPDVKARIEAERRKQAADLFLARQVEAQFKPDDAQLREIFHSTADFAYFDSATFETMDAANAALARIRGGATFAEAAKAAPVSSVAASPEAAPARMRGELDPALATAIFSAAPRAVVGPAQTQLGAVIARVHRKDVGTEEQFQARREQLRAWARKQFEGSMRAQYAKHLRETSHVQLDEKFLQSIGTGTPSEAQLDHVLAKVGGRPLRYRDIYETLRMMGATSGHLASASTRIGIAWKEIEKRLIEDVAVERGVDRAPELVARAPEIERAALALADIEEIRRKTGPATKAEVEAFYRRNAAAYGGAPLERVRADAAARATDEKQVNAITSRIEGLRKVASISVDRAALAKVAI